MESTRNLYTAPVSPTDTHILTRGILVCSLPKVFSSGKSFFVAFRGSGGNRLKRRVLTGRAACHGVWENGSPLGDVNSHNPAQRGASFISLDCSLKGNPGALRKTAFVILTPFRCLSNLNSPPGPLHVFSCFEVSLPSIAGSCWEIL